MNDIFALFSRFLSQPSPILTVTFPGTMKVVVTTHAGWKTACISKMKVDETGLILLNVLTKKFVSSALIRNEKVV